MERQSAGLRGEDLACAYLKKHRYAIIARRYRTRFGEVDIIAVRRNALVFCEVKARSSERYGTPAEAVTWKKQRKIFLTAQAYLLEHPHDGETRFDVLEVNLSSGMVRHIENAFSNPMS